MKCCKCHRPLKSAISQQRCMGIICYCHYLVAQSKNGHAQEVILEGALQDVGLVVKRLSNGRVAANVPHLIKYHSSTGFECGNSSSESADLALNILHFLIPTTDFVTEVSGIQVTVQAYALHQDFKRDFIETMDKEGGNIPISVLHAWVEIKSRNFDELTASVSFD